MFSIISALADRLVQHLTNDGEATSDGEAISDGDDLWEDMEVDDNDDNDE